MRLNYLFSLVAFASFAVPSLTAPIGLSLALDPEELKIECDKTYTELEDIISRKNIGLPVGTEVEVKITNLKAICTPKERIKSNSSLAVAVLTTQGKLDALKPKIQEVMNGPMGSIEKKIGELMIEVHTEVQKLNGATRTFIGAEADVVYGNPTGGPQLTTDELAKIVHTFFSRISELETIVKDVSGYAFTSAQQNIRKDILAIKKALGIVSSQLADGVANMMLKTSMGYSALV
ncbi:hypothetical protein B0J17DRAFT_731609 [Rhizoctonia solani]|nr:hypothetical protein B0J17DRAFT_731609 [Rhizoctonia solani]